jgi:putative ribosome biogenesis GTPase RsgA
VLAYPEELAANLEDEKVHALIYKNFVLTQASKQNTCDLSQIDSSSLLEQYKPLVVVGPSGAGKGTLISQLTTKF